jgi:FemAB-related protein (PEP-CTERM system-associated)
MASTLKEISEHPAVNLPALPASLRICSLTQESFERWDRFVLEHPGGSPFHLTSWKRSMENTFGFEPCYLYAERAGQITAVAPLFVISNWIMGRCLLSTPFAVYGGICAADAESGRFLIDHLKELAHSEAVQYLELRFRQHEPLPQFAPNTLYSTFTSHLSPDPEANLKRLPRDTRYMIRKSAKFGLRAQRGLDQLDAFYQLFSLNLLQHGTPAIPLTLFKNLIREFGGSTDLLMVYSGAKPVTGVFSFIYRDTILPYYAGASDEAYGLSANNFMYWELMKNAALDGVLHFDFGRSKRGTGSFNFKSQWNMIVEPLDYQIHLVKRKELPNFSPVNPKFQLAANLWKKMPLRLANWLGPRVVRWFP